MTIAFSEERFAKDVPTNKIGMPLPLPVVETATFEFCRFVQVPIILVHTTGSISEFSVPDIDGVVTGFDTDVEKLCSARSRRHRPGGRSAAGAGSKTLAGEGIFISRRRTLLFADSTAGATPGARLHKHPLYRCPRYACTPAVLAIVPVGIARGAIDTFIAYATGKPSAVADGLRIRKRFSSNCRNRRLRSMRRGC